MRCVWVGQASQSGFLADFITPGTPGSHFFTSHTQPCTSTFVTDCVYPFYLLAKFYPLLSMLNVCMFS